MQGYFIARSSLNYFRRFLENYLCLACSNDSTIKSAAFLGLIVNVVSEKLSQTV